MIWNEDGPSRGQPERANRAETIQAISALPPEKPNVKPRQRFRTGVKTLAAANHSLTRTTFRTSRLLDFCSEKELVAQTGHRPAQWALVVLKELQDNGLDA